MSPAASPDFAALLGAAGPHPSLGRHAETYGRLIGSWIGAYRDQGPDETEIQGSMEVHFAWVLQGLAVQDLWIAPGTADRAAGVTARRDTWGTTLRVFDPGIEAWRVEWFNPVKQVRSSLIGRRIGDDIVQFGNFEGRTGKWVFSDISPDAFTWRAHVLADDGVAWNLQTEFCLRRA